MKWAESYEENKQWDYYRNNVQVFHEYNYLMDKRHLSVCVHADTSCKTDHLSSHVWQQLWSPREQGLQARHLAHGALWGRLSWNLELLFCQIPDLMTFRLVEVYCCLLQTVSDYWKDVCWFELHLKCTLI